MARSVLVTSMGALLGALGWSFPLAAAEPAALPTAWLDAQVNERGQHCDKRAEQVDAKRVLLACGSAGVWEVEQAEAGPRFVRSYELGGDVVGFFIEADGRLWVKLQVLEARPFSSARSQTTVTFPDAATTPPAEPGSTAPVPEAKPEPNAGGPVTTVPRRVGKVIQSAPGEVVITLGGLDGIARGDKIELALQRGDDDETGDAALSRELLAVGVVAQVTERSAKVRLGLNEQVPLDAVALRSRSYPTASLSAPPRVGNLWDIEAMVRPFAAIGELGGGILFSGSIGRRFESNWYVRAVVDPAGFGDVENREAMGTMNGAVVGSYDSHYFEMGLGLGAQTVNVTDFLIPPGSGLTVAQYLRLGAQDGLNLTARTSVVLFHSQFDFGGLVGNAQIPVTRGYWLQLGGGGGAVGYGYGEIGLRVLVTGNGGVGSRFLTVSAGAAGVFRTAGCNNFGCGQTVDYTGPMAGIGSEWRF